MLTKTKLALRVKTNAFDAELTDLIAAAKADLLMAGICPAVVETPEAFPLCGRAIISFVKFHFGEPEDPVRIKAAYDELKAQMMVATGYTVYEEA